MKNKIMLMAVVAAFLGSIALVGCGDQPAAGGDAAGKKPETATKAPDAGATPETKAPETKAPDAAATAGDAGAKKEGETAGAPGAATPPAGEGEKKEGEAPKTPEAGK
ncbi:MAG: hypothetical protein JSS65_09375 [Armatimonadetes bacterium]|nr:hypothetical protein [Armatimonadota bacterium]